MNTITIPKNLIHEIRISSSARKYEKLFPYFSRSTSLIKNDDLVVLPRKEYEQLVSFWANAETIPKRTKTAIKKGFLEIAKGEFLTSKQVKNALGL